MHNQYHFRTRSSYWSFLHVTVVHAVRAWQHAPPQHIYAPPQTIYAFTCHYLGHLTHIYVFTCHYLRHLTHIYAFTCHYITLPWVKLEHLTHWLRDDLSPSALIPS